MNLCLSSLRDVQTDKFEEDRSPGDKLEKEGSPSGQMSHLRGLKIPNINY